MVQAWYMDAVSPSKPMDQMEEHKCSPHRPVDLAELKKKTGVEYFLFEPENGAGNKFVEPKDLQQLKKERGYTYEDELIISKDLVDYDKKMQMFFTEHLHGDEEIRYCLEGSGYFDVRDENDEWIRILMGGGDMIILPAGIYHRFTLDTKRWIHVKRFFVGDPEWTPVNRPADDHWARVQYLKDRKELMQSVKG